MSAERAAAFRRPGRYQIEAMIAAVHCEAPSWKWTDWPQIVALYSVLLTMDDSPVVRLSQVVARRYVDGPAAALRAVEELSNLLPEYHLFHATRARLLRELGQNDEAAREDAVALTLTRNRGEQALLEERLSSYEPGMGSAIEIVGRLSIFLGLRSSIRDEKHRRSYHRAESVPNRIR